MVIPILLLAAFVMTLVHAARPSAVPIWVPVLLVSMALLLNHSWPFVR